MHHDSLLTYCHHRGHPNSPPHRCGHPTFYSHCIAHGCSYPPLCCPSPPWHCQLMAAQLLCYAAQPLCGAANSQPSARPPIAVHPPPPGGSSPTIHAHDSSSCQVLYAAPRGLDLHPPKTMHPPFSTLCLSSFFSLGRSAHPWQLQN